jgi:hypothetical protein
MLLAQCAIWRGDIFLWKEAKKHIFEATCKDDHDRELVSLSLAIIDSSIYDNKDYPEWFKTGNFEELPGDAHPAAKVFYIKYLYMAAYSIATKQHKLEGMEGLSMMRLLPNIIEPLISQAVLDGTIIPEMYLHMSCAVAYHNSAQKDKAIAHMDKAIKLALADRHYGFLTEYVRHFGDLLEQLMLDVLDLDDGFDNAVNIGNGLGHVGLNREQGLDLSNLLGGHAALGDTLSQIILGPLFHVGADSLVHVVHNGLVAIDGRIQGDLTTHTAAADNADTR